MAEELTIYKGGCHCGGVRFELRRAPITEVVECNCSHCQMKGLLLTFMPREQFTLTQGEDQLTEYRFNKEAIAHQFCKVCGVQPFAFGQNKDGEQTATINVRCIDDIDLMSIKRIPFNGKDY